MDIGFQELFGAFGFHRRFGFRHSQLLQGELVERNVHVTLVFYLHPFTDTGDTVIQSIIQFYLYAFQVIRSFEIEREHLTRRFTRLYQRPAFIRPIDTGSQLSDIESCHPERVRQDGQTVDPFV